MARMLGTCRQPFCKKCCGTKRKADTQVIKRAVKRAEKAQFRQDLIRGRM